MTTRSLDAIDRELAKVREILRRIVVDYAVELCDDLPGCDCSLAQAWRLIYVRDEKQDESPATSRDGNDD